MHASFAKRRQRLSLALLLVALGLACLARGAEAQQPVAASASVTGLEVRAEELVLGISALDAAGNPLTGLGTAQFTATIDGAPAAVTSVNPALQDNLPLAVVLVTDVSGSMAGEPIARARDALQLFVGALQPTDRAAIVAFSGSVRTVQPFTADRGVLAAAIDTLTASGDTALYSAVAEGIATAAAAPEPRKAIVLLSDGEDFGGISTITREAVISLAATSRIPIFAVGIGAAIDAPFLEALAGPTGGEAAVASTPAELAGLYDRISQRLRLQYTVRIALPADGLAPGEHRAVVTVAGVAVEALFSVEAPATPAVTATAVPTLAPPTIGALPATLAEAITIPVSGIPPGAAVSFSIDGTPQGAAATGAAPEVMLDPYALSPGEHTLTVFVSSDGRTSESSQPFSVPALAPRITGPESLDGLDPGDTFTVVAQSQGRPLTVRVLSGGQELGRLEEPPFVFTLPSPPDGVDQPELVIEVSDANGAASRSYRVRPAPGSSGPPAIGYVMIGLGAAAVLVAALATARWRWRTRPSRHRLPASGAAASVLAGAGPASAGPVEAPPAVPPGPAAKAPWGYLAVLEGPDAGRRFPLSAQAELAGSGRACSIRLRDRTVEASHCVIAPPGAVRASSPDARLEVNGLPLQHAALGAGDILHIGQTYLEFQPS